MTDIALSELLIQLRRDLLAAQAEGEGQDLRFAVVDAEVELQVTATKESAGGGGVRLWVFDANGSAKQTDAATQKIRLKLQATDGEGRPLQISGKGILRE